jgi:membrane-bound inhibitor of C-type lysozyme
MKGFIASSISILTVVSMAFIGLPVLAEQTIQPTEKTKNQHSDKTQSASPGNVITKAAYKCDEGKGFTAVYRDDGTAETTFGSKVLILNQVESGSGARYSNGGVTLFTKGDTAFVEVGENKLFANCVATGAGVQGMW